MDEALGIQVAAGDIGSMVRAARAARRLTQEQLAAAAGIARPRLIKIECGTLVNPRLSDAFALERVLGIPVDAWRSGARPGSAGAP